MIGISDSLVHADGIQIPAVADSNGIIDLGYFSIYKKKYYFLMFFTAKICVYFYRIVLFLSRNRWLFWHSFVKIDVQVLAKLQKTNLIFLLTSCWFNIIDILNAKVQYWIESYNGLFKLGNCDRTDWGTRIWIHSS